jgi:hypothetical protein
MQKIYIVLMLFLLVVGCSSDSKGVIKLAYIQFFLVNAVFYPYFLKIYFLLLIGGGFGSGLSL